MNEKEEVIKKIETILGRVPDNTRTILNVLVHPDVINTTKRYIHVHDRSDLCQRYAAPWSCVREAEARFENLRLGWLGAASDVLDEIEWCEPCKNKLE